MTEMEARLAKLETHWMHADRQMVRQAEAMETITKALAVLTTRIEGLPRKVEEASFHDAENRAVASERERVGDNTRQVIGIAVSVGGVAGALVFGILNFIQRGGL